MRHYTTINTGEKKPKQTSKVDENNSAVHTICPDPGVGMVWASLGRGAAAWG